MKSEWIVFDIDKPLLSDDAEERVMANTAKEALAKVYSLNEGECFKPYSKGRFVVYKNLPRARKQVYGIFKKSL